MACIDNEGIKIEQLSDKEILFIFVFHHILSYEDKLFVNHTLIIAKQYLFSCRYHKYLPSIKPFNSKIKTGLASQLEAMMVKSNNKLKAHNIKWRKYKSN